MNATVAPYVTIIGLAKAPIGVTELEGISHFWIYAISDLLIAISYFSITVALLALLSQPRELAYRWLFKLFTLLIFLCGCTQVLDLWMLSNGVFKLQTAVNFIYAIASVGVGIAIWPFLTKASPLSSVRALTVEVADSKREQENLEKEQSQLRTKVEESSTQLSLANRELQRMAAIVDSSNDAIIACDLHGKILSWNLAATKLFQTQAYVAIGTTVSEFFRPDMRNLITEKFRNLQRGQGDCNFQIDYPQSALTLKLSITVSPFLKEDLELAGYSLSIRDITEQKRLEERFQIAFEAAPNAMLLIDRERKVILSNKKGEELFGYPRPRLLGLSTDTLLSKLIDSELLTDISSNSNSFGPLKNENIEGVGCRADGTTFPIEVNIMPIESREETMYISAIVDISDRKLTRERLTNSIKEKEILLKEIHHRVKNNMQIISSLLRLQSRQVEDPKLKEILQESEERVRSMALVHEKLYSSGGVNRVDFKSYTEQLASDLFGTYMAGARRVKLHLSIANVELGIDKAVPCGLLLNELISNCFKHAFPDNRIGQVSIDLNRVGPMLVLKVSDNGVGLPKDTDLNSPRTLGLRVVRTLCEQLGASLKIPPGVGTTFNVTFPDTEGLNTEWRHNGTSQHPSL